MKQHHRAKLDYNAVQEMRRKRQVNRHRYTYRELGQMFGCGESTARDIVNFKTRVGA